MLLILCIVLWEYMTNTFQKGMLRLMYLFPIVILFSKGFFEAHTLFISLACIHLLSLTIYPISMICKKLSIKTIGEFVCKSMLKYIGVFMSSVSIFVVSFYAAEKNVVIFKYFLNIITGIFVISVIVGVFWLSIIPFISYYSQNKLLKKIDFQLCNDREVIYKHFTTFTNNKVKRKYVNLLELYVHNASGEWPDKNIFKITSNPANIRLAQLEEKWLGINR